MAEISQGHSHSKVSGKEVLGLEAHIPLSSALPFYTRGSTEFQ